MPSPFDVETLGNGASLVTADASGNLTVSGAATIGNAILLKAQPTAPVPPPGYLVLYSPDGKSLSTVAPGGQSASQTIGGNLTVTGTATVTGVLAENGGTNSAGSAPVLTPTFANGTAAQLADLTRDYMLYLTVGTAGSAFTVNIGPTSGTANTVISSSTPNSGESISVRIPAGWFVKWAGTTTTIANQLAVGC